MVKINCRTNLDLHNEKWPKELPEVPRVGDYINSGNLRDGNHGWRLSLEVVRVTWCSRLVDEYGTIEWYCEVELHLGNVWKSRTLRDFYEWYAPAIGKRASFFI